MLAESRRTTQAAPPSEAERALLALLAEGWSVPEAARQLGCGVRTAQRYVESLRLRWHLASREQVYALAGEAGYMRVPGGGATW